MKTLKFKLLILFLVVLTIVPYVFSQEDLDIKDEKENTIYSEDDYFKIFVAKDVAKSPSNLFEHKFAIYNKDLKEAKRLNISFIYDDEVNAVLELLNITFVEKLGEKEEIITEAIKEDIDLTASLTANSEKYAVAKKSNVLENVLFEANETKNFTIRYYFKDIFLQTKERKKKWDLYIWKGEYEKPTYSLKVDPAGSINATCFQINNNRTILCNSSLISGDSLITNRSIIFNYTYLNASHATGSDLHINSTRTITIINTTLFGSGTATGYNTDFYINGKEINITKSHLIGNKGPNDFFLNATNNIYINDSLLDMHGPSTYNSKCIIISNNFNATNTTILCYGGVSTATYAPGYGYFHLISSSSYIINSTIYSFGGTGSDQNGAKGNFTVYGKDFYMEKSKIDARGGAASTSSCNCVAGQSGLNFKLNGILNLTTSYIYSWQDSCARYTSSNTPLLRGKINASYINIKNSSIYYMISSDTVLAYSCAGGSVYFDIQGINCLINNTLIYTTGGKGGSALGGNGFAGGSVYFDLNCTNKLQSNFSKIYLAGGQGGNAETTTYTVGGGGSLFFNLLSSNINITNSSIWLLTGLTGTVGLSKGNDGLGFFGLNATNLFMSASTVYSRNRTTVNLTVDNILSLKDWTNFSLSEPFLLSEMKGNLTFRGTDKKLYIYNESSFKYPTYAYCREGTTLKIYNETKFNSNLSIDATTCTKVFFNPLTVTLDKPEENSIKGTDVTIRYNFSVDKEVINCSLYTNTTGTWAKTALNSSAIVVGRLMNFTVGTYSTGTYIWNIKCFMNYTTNGTVSSDNETAWGEENRTLIIYDVTDTTVPSFSNADNKTTNYKSQTTTMNITASDASSISGYFFSWNYSGTWINESWIEINPSAAKNLNVSKILNLTPGKTIAWKFYANDTLNNMGGSSTYIIKIGNRAPTITLFRPNNNINRPKGNQTFNFSVSDADTGIKRCDLWINHTSVMKYNTTNSSLINSTYNVSITTNKFSDKESFYNWSVRCFDNSTLLNTTTRSDARIFWINDTNATISFTNKPANDSTWDPLWGYYVEFNFTQSNDYGYTNCSLWGNFTGTWHKNQTNTTPITSTYQFSSVKLGLGKYIWSVQCYENTSVARERWAGGTKTANYTLNLTSRKPTLYNTVLSPTSPSLTTSTKISTQALDQGGVSPYRSISFVNFTVQAPNGTQVINSAIGTNSTNTWESSYFTPSSAGTWRYSLMAKDNYSEIATATYYFSVTDPTAPNVTIYRPSNNTYLQNSSANYTKVTFNFTVQDNVGLNNCTLWTNHQSDSFEINKSLTTINNKQNNSFNVIIYKPGIYTWNVNCTDGTYNSWSAKNFTLNVIDEESQTIGYNYTLSTPTYATSNTFQASVSDRGGDKIESRLVIYSPNGTAILSLSNGTQDGNLWAWTFTPNYKYSGNYTWFLYTQDNNTHTVNASGYFKIERNKTNVIDVKNSSFEDYIVFSLHNMTYWDLNLTVYDFNLSYAKLTIRNPNNDIYINQISGKQDLTKNFSQHNQYWIWDGKNQTMYNTTGQWNVTLDIMTLGGNKTKIEQLFNVTLNATYMPLTYTNSLVTTTTELSRFNISFWLNTNASLKYSFIVDMINSTDTILGNTGIWKANVTNGSHISQTFTMNISRKSNESKPYKFRASLQPSNDTVKEITHYGNVSITNLFNSFESLIPIEININPPSLNLRSYTSTTTSALCTSSYSSSCYWNQVMYTDQNYKKCWYINNTGSFAGTHCDANIYGNIPKDSYYVYFNINKSGWVTADTLDDFSFSNATVEVCMNFSNPPVVSASRSYLNFTCDGTSLGYDDSLESGNIPVITLSATSRPASTVVVGGGSSAGGGGGTAEGPTETELLEIVTAVEEEIRKPLDINFDTLITCIWDKEISCIYSETWFVNLLLYFLLGVLLLALLYPEQKGKKSFSSFFGGNNEEQQK